MTRYYLAHPIGERHKIRAWELGFEARTGIELVNPFYDTERGDIKAIDAGTMTPFDAGLDYRDLVEGDIYEIDTSEGLVAFVDRNVPSIGTFMEIWYCAMTLGMPVYIVSPNWDTHPWLRYVVEVSGGFIVKTFEDFEQRIVEEEV